MNDAVAGPYLGLGLLPHGFIAFPAIDCSFVTGILRAAFFHVPTRADLPPPLTSPTLLSQHCALIN